MAGVQRAHRRDEADRAVAARLERRPDVGDRPAGPHATATVASASTRYIGSSSGRVARIASQVPLDRLPVAALDRAGQLEAVLDRPPHQRVERLGRRSRRLEQRAGRVAERDEVVGGDRGAGVVGGAILVGERERAQAEGLGEPGRDARAPRRSRPSRPPRRRRAAPAPRRRVNVCSGCTLKRRVWGASAASGVAPLTCATHGPGATYAADLADRAVGDAEEDELGLARVEREPALEQARSDRRADAAAADHVDTFDHAVRAPVPRADTGLRSSVTNRGGPVSVPATARSGRRDGDGDAVEHGVARDRVDDGGVGEDVHVDARRGRRRPPGACPAARGPSRTGCRRRPGMTTSVSSTGTSIEPAAELTWRWRRRRGRACRRRPGGAGRRSCPCRARAPARSASTSWPSAAGGGRRAPCRPRRWRRGRSRAGPGRRSAAAARARPCRTPSRARRAGAARAGRSRSRAGCASSSSSERPSGRAPNASPRWPVRSRRSSSRSSAGRSPSAATISSGVAAVDRATSGSATASATRAAERRRRRAPSGSASAPSPAAIAASRTRISNSDGEPGLALEDRRREVGHVADRERREREVVVRLLEHRGRRQDHVGVAGRRVQVRVDADHQLEPGQQAVEAPGVGRRQGRVAGDRQQRPHLPLAGRLHLVGERRDRAARPAPPAARARGCASGRCGMPAAGGAAARGRRGGTSRRRAGRGCPVRTLSTSTSQAASVPYAVVWVPIRP